MSRPEWPLAIESLNDYCRSSFNLPSDNSLISPIARVILQKRRLLKIQEIHNLLLEVSSEPSESLAQGEYEKEFLMKFRPTFSNVRWNELSGCEAHALSTLIVDTLLRCQADAQLVNNYIKEAVAEIQGPDFKTRTVALRSCLILIRCIFKAFPKQAGMWANDLLKAILNSFKTSHSSSNCFDYVLEGLKCLQIILRLPKKFTEPKEREKIPLHISKYLGANSTFIAIESAKLYEAYFETLEVITRKDVKEILEHLNGGLSFRLQEYKCSPRLLEFCFELKPEKGHMDNSIFARNIERIRSYSYIDTRLFSDALVNCLLRKPEDEALNILFLLLPVKGSKTFVSAKCFAKTIELLVERTMIYNDAIRTIRFVFEKILLERLHQFSDEYSIELIGTLTRLFVKFPESLTENDFTSFVPLTRSNNILQLMSVELITRVLKDRPIVLCSQVTLIYAQLKGDFLRLKLQEKTVLRDAVKGLLKLFSKVLKLSIELYSNYCDHEMISKVKDWVVSQLKINEETEWLRNDEEIVHGLLLIATVFASDFDVTSTVIEFTNSSVNFGSLLGYFLNLVTNDPEQYRLFFGSIEKCLHELNIQDHSKLPCVRKLFPLIKIVVDNKKNEFQSDSLVFLIVKSIVISEYFGSYSTRDDFDLLNTKKEQVNFAQLVEYFAKLFWRSSDKTQDYCMTLMLSSLKQKTAVIPSQILQTVRAILECSEIKIVDSGHQGLLINQIQKIVKEFLLDDSFEVRLECGIVLGSIVKLFDPSDVEAINDLFKQSMKHAMKSTASSKEQKSRVCYIMGIVTLKANLESEHVKALELTSNALIGLIASWNRENSFETKGIEREIASASMFALAYFIEKCGCHVNAEFYRDSCELLLEQVLMKDRCEAMVKSVRELAKSLALYVNLLPSQSQFITKTVRLLLESGYLSYYGNDCIDLLLEISEFNPQITIPSALIYILLKSNAAYHTRGSFGTICQYLNLQISFNPIISYDLIDSGFLIYLLERANNPECFDVVEYESLSFLVNKLINLTIVDRFDFWIEFVFEPLNLSGGERVSSKVPANEDLSNSAFSLTDLKDLLKPSLSLRPSTVLMLLGPLSQNIGRLVEIDLEKLKKFLNFAIRICFNISAEKTGERKFYLTGIGLFRGIVRTFSTIFDENGVCILEPFDSQIVSIISSALRSSEEGDPLFAACSFGSLFSLVSNRKDFQEDLKNGTGRVFNLVKKAISLLKEQQIFWTVEIVENLILLSIILGFCSLQQSDFDLSCLDSELQNCLNKAIGDCFAAYNSGTLERNIRLSLSGQDRLLLISTLLNSNSIGSEVIDGLISILIGMNSENMEQVFQLSGKLFSFDAIESASTDILIQLLQQISSFGLGRNDPLAIQCISPLYNNEKYKHLVIEFLNKLSSEFLTSRFNDFDTQYGLAAVKAQQNLISPDQDQSILFGILKKLVGNCLNDLEVNNCKDMLKSLKLIFSNPQISKEFANDLLIEWIDRLNEIDSIFLNQLVFFSISSQPQIWSETTFKGLKNHFEKMLKSVNTLEMALDSWILLLKAQSKILEVDALMFDDFVDNCTEQISGAFEKYRGDGIDPVWERIFGIAQTICNSSEKELKKTADISSKALEELNDFK